MTSMGDRTREERAVRPTVGFVGLGTMGAPMCRRLLTAGFPVVVHDRRPRCVAAAVSAGAVSGRDVAGCAARADVLLTSLPGPAEVDGAMRCDGGLAALRAGSLWVDLTTGRRADLLALAASAPDGVGVVDAPVTGAVDGARRGRLTIFAGGRPGDVERATTVLDELGSVVPCGPLGSGTVVKLVTNQLWFAAAAALGEGFAVGVANGVDLSVLWQAIRASVGDSFAAGHDAPSIFAGHYDPSFPLALCVKDLGLIAELEAAVDADLPLTAAARDAFLGAARRYGTQAGELHVARRIEDDAGLSFRVAGDWTPPWAVDDGHEGTTQIPTGKETTP